jgi:two-component system chemotaxis response regulator CheY
VGGLARTYNFERISLIVADPSKYMRTLLVGLARSFGFRTVYEAKDGEAALTLMKERHVDIVLIEGPMEPMNGFAFIHHLRTSPESPNPFLPIIMVSAHTEIGQVKKARDAGVTEFLAKPVSAKTLLMRFCAVVDAQRAFVRCPTYVGPDRRRHDDSSFLGPERRGVPLSARETPSASLGQPGAAADVATPAAPQSVQ